MMTFVKGSALLLLLAAVSIKADHGPEHCDGLNVTIKAKDLSKTHGDWVLVWAVSDHDEGWTLLNNVTSSHVEMRLYDNSTLSFLERNVYGGNSCHKYEINMTVPADAEQHSLFTNAATLERDGVPVVYNESGEAYFFETCADCMVMIYKGKEGRFLLIYRKEGGHRDVEKLKESHDENKKLAACLGFSHEGFFSYDGATDFCHKKSAPEAPAAEA